MRLLGSTQLFMNTTIFFFFTQALMKVQKIIEREEYSMNNKIIEIKILKIREVSIIKTNSI